MAIQFFSTKAAADAIGGETSWCIGSDGKPLAMPWRAATGADMTPVVIDADKEAVKSYAKLVALKNMTPAQVSSWVDANVTNLSQAQDAIKTLAIGMGHIIRQIF